MSKSIQTTAEKKRVLIKAGGSVLQDPACMDSFARLIAEKKTESPQTEWIIVHGGGPAINAELALHQIKWTTVDGLRVTTPEMMKIIEQVLKGRVNSDLSNSLRKSGINVVSLSGGDSGLLLCSKLNPALEWVGQVQSVNTPLITLLLNNSYVPVIAPIGVDQAGNKYNINADSAASALAVALGCDELIFVTDQDGVWDEKKLPVSRVNSVQLKKWIVEKVVLGGMLAKANAILAALDANVTCVRIVNGKNKTFWESSHGTFCNK